MSHPRVGPLPALDLRIGVSARRLQGAARACAVIAAGWLAFSTAGSGAFLMLAVLCWALSGQWRATMRVLARDPAASTALALFAALCLGTMWSRAPVAQALAALGKYRELAFFAVMVFLFNEAVWRRRLFMALFGSAALVLAASYALHFGLVAPPDPARMATDGAVVLKNSITHSFLMSLLAYSAACLALRATGAQRAALVAVALLGALNVLVAVHGRTGYVVLATLLLWFAFSNWSARGALAALIAIAVAGSAAYAWSPSFKGRIDRTFVEMREDPKRSSVGQRLVFWKHSVHAVAAAPLLGAGTGGWADSFHEAGAGGDPFFHDRSHTHPHNEYLHLAVQLGLGGLLLFVAMLVVAFSRAGRLEPGEAAYARGVILAFAVGCLFNDFLYDSTEGHLWALLVAALLGGVRRPASIG